MTRRLCRALWPVKEAGRVLIAVLIALLIAVAAVLIAGCADVRPPAVPASESSRAGRPQARTARDDCSSCINAARWHALASDQAAMGAIAPGTFAAIDEAWDGAVEVCRQVLTGAWPLAAADVATVQGFAATTQESMR
jgi:hypothetical protein